MPLGHQADGGAEQERVGDRRDRGERDERIVGFRVVPCGRAVGAPRGQRDVRVLGVEERVEATFLDGPTKVGRGEATVSRERNDPNLHAGNRR